MAAGQTTFLTAGTRAPVIDSPRSPAVATSVRIVGEPPSSEADHLSVSQRSTIRRAVQEAVDAHGFEYAMRTTCKELEAKYGISYQTIEYLINDELPIALPEQLLTTGQRNRIRREFQAVANSTKERSRGNVATAEVVKRFSELFGVSEDAIQLSVLNAIISHRLTHLEDHQCG